MKILELTATGGALRVDAVDPKWVRVTLVQQGAERDVGAEALKYIADHLRAFLANPSERLKWVLTLSETHVTMYGSTLGDHVLLRLQDKNAKFFADLELSQVDRERWLSILRAPPGTC